ncbi:hypothetical protein J6253_07385 [bacterium]|nr:hypothetical protein [bacterium]MBP5591691.1 hypothetical protein [bacterium]
MKKIFVVFALLSAVFMVSCGGSSSNDDVKGRESVADKGKLGEECYPNETCDEGLKCDTENNICVEENTNHSDDSDTPSEPNDDDRPDSSNPADDNDTESSDDADTTPVTMAEGIHLGIIGFNELLFQQNKYAKPIGLLNKETVESYTDFIDSLDSPDDGTVLYFADYTALEMMHNYPVPADLQLKKVALVTFTDGLDNISTSPAVPEYNPGNYDDKKAYRDALHEMIVNDPNPINGMPIDAYTIGLKGKDVKDDTEFEDTLNKLASSESNVFHVENMSEAMESFDIIARSLYSISKTVNLDVKVPGGEDNGQLFRFTFDIYCDRNSDYCDKDAADSELYIDATYNKSELTLEKISYEGFSKGKSKISAGDSEGAYYHFVFEDIKYDDGKTPLSDSDYQMINLWKMTGNGIWNHESEFKPGTSSELIEVRSSALIMLVLDCTTSLGKDFANMKQTARDFVTTLVNGGTDTRVAECTGLPANAEWNTADKITQTWDDYNGWHPTAVGSYSETSSTNECYYKCVSGYTWNGSYCAGN